MNDLVTAHIINAERSSVMTFANIESAMRWISARQHWQVKEGASEALSLMQHGREILRLTLYAPTIERIR